MSKPRFASKVDVNNNLSRPVTQHYLLKRRESAFAKPDHMIASSESRNSSKNMLKFSSNDMVHNHYLDEARKKIQERDRNSKIIPTGKILTSSTSKDDGEPTHGSNVDIPKIHECKHNLDLSAGTSLTGQQKQRIDFSASTSFNVKQENLRSFAVSTADASDKRQQQPDSTSSTSTLPKTITADGNFDL
ncbi:hypothetical protein Tco_0420441 [Tanacetum coccineum]